MRSRDDTVDGFAAVERALDLGVVGVGERGPAGERERILRRLERFAAVPDGSFVWTRDVDGSSHVGRMTGPVRPDPDGAVHDLVHVRPCDWLPAPYVPEGVEATFRRGGRNFQQIHGPGVEEETAALWEAQTGQPLASR